MSRCKCCDKLLAQSDFRIKKPQTEELEDMCPACRYVAYNPDKLRTKSYQFEDLTENCVITIDRK